MKCLCLVVPRKKAEDIRRRLIEENLMIEGVKTKRKGEYVYFPIKKRVNIKGCRVCEEDFEEIKRKSYEDILKEKGISLDSISIDFVGDIAIIRLKDEGKAEEVARAIMEANRHVKTVCLDKGVKEDYRIRDIKIIAGEKRTETVHTEYGLKMKVDVSKVYFSPRLAEERMRVARQVCKDEIIIDMFSGVAPFSLTIAKFAKPRKIYAIDKNEYAVKYARENVKINKMGEVIEVLEGDAREVVKILPEADHIIMNLPHKSFEFLPVAIKKGKILHYYEIIEREKVNGRIEEIMKFAEEIGYKIEIKNVRRVGSYSPSKDKFGMELYVKSKTC